jgi:hypothetical protein
MLTNFLHGLASHNYVSPLHSSLHLGEKRAFRGSGRFKAFLLSEKGGKVFFIMLNMRCVRDLLGRGRELAVTVGF